MSQLFRGLSWRFVTVRDTYGTPLLDTYPCFGDETARVHHVVHSRAGHLSTALQRVT